MLLPGAIFEIKIHQNAFAAHWGSLQRSQTPWLVLGGRFAAGEGKEESRGEGREGGKGEGRVAFPHFFFLTI